jgi:uncharacterized protein
MENMTEEELKKIICPHCSTGYRVPFKIIGKTVACKKCGETFTACEPSPTLSPPRIGKLAVKYKLMSSEQLNSALSIQSAMAAKGKNASFETILLENKMLSSQHLQLLNLTMDFWEVSQVAKEFGAFAVEKGVVSQANVEKALQKQAVLFKESKTIKSMKDLLVEEGLLTNEDRDALVLELASAPKNAVDARKDGDLRVETPSLDEDNEDQEDSSAKETKDGNQSLSIKEIEKQCEVTVAEDKMAAFLVLKKTFSGCTSEDIRPLLDAHNISFGVLDDAAIGDYLSADPHPDEPLEVAKGTPPGSGIDGTLTYHFSTNQKIGSIGAQGKIDFKEKGEVPFVHKGDLLLEKIPPKNGEPGTNVHGEPVPGDKPADVKIRVGSGTELSEDKLKAYAKADGQPKLSFGGRLSVMSDLDISGDVDLKTGHVDFEGNVKVTGTVQNGFRIKSTNLSAKEIMAAEVIASGDVTTTGGIIGATIHAQGNIKAKYIKNANITTYGDILVEKEITDATLSASGTCIVKRGKILATKISAKKGIEAVDIGTDVSSPCRLNIGMDEHIENEVARIEAKWAPLSDNRDTLQQSVENMTQQQQAIHNKIADMAQVQDRSLVAQREIQKKLEASSLPDDSEERQKLEGTIKALGEKATAADDTLGKLFDKQDKLAEDTEAAQDKISQLEEQIEELKHEKTAISDWAQTQKAIPVIKVSGAIFQGTMINAPHSKAVIKETSRHAAIREVMTSEPDEPPEWEVKVQPLK